MKSVLKMSLCVGLVVSCFSANAAIQFVLQMDPNNPPDLTGSFSAEQNVVSASVRGKVSCEKMYSNDKGIEFSIIKEYADLLPTAFSQPNLGENTACGQEFASSFVRISLDNAPQGSAVCNQQISNDMNGKTVTVTFSKTGVVCHVA